MLLGKLDGTATTKQHEVYVCRTTSINDAEGAEKVPTWVFRAMTARFCPHANPTGGVAAPRGIAAPYVRQHKPWQLNSEQ